MSEKLDPNKINNGYTWEAMMQTLLTFEDPKIKIYSRQGKDFAIDAVSEDSKTVYQAKHHKSPSISKSITDAKNELEKIKKYREEKEYWKKATKWILFTNIEINIEGEEKWNESIIPLFKEEDLSAELYNWEKIRTLLFKNPAVIGPFFRDEPRIFTTISEEIFRQEKESWYAPALNVECIGREDAFSKFDDFINSQKRIWPVSGPGGMGKTRFLLECAKRLSSEWTPHWILPDLVMHPSLYKEINPERNIILFIDELSNIERLNLLINELINGRMKTWKIVFSERTHDSPTIKQIEKGKYSQIAYPLYKLSKLNVRQSEDLIKQLLTNLKLHFTDTIDNIAYRLSKITAGIPLWIGLCVKLIEEKGNIDDLPDTAEKLRNDYTSWSFQSLNEININKDQAEELLIWLSLYGKAELENKEILSFLSSKTGLSKSKVLKVCEVLVNKGIAFRTGAKNRFIKIAPDSIRDEILKKSLIDVYNHSKFAEDVTNLILSDKVDKVPQKEMIIENLAYIQYLLDSKTNEKIELISPIIDDVLKRIEQGTTTEQIEAIKLIDNFCFARPKDALSILRSCWENDRGEESLMEETWGDYKINHENVRKKIPWKLFHISRFFSDIADQELIYNFYCVIISTELDLGKRFYSESNYAGTQTLLERTLFSEDWSEEYNQLAKSEADKLLTKLQINKNLTNLEIILFHLLLTGLTAAEHMVWGPNYGDRFQYRRIYTLPERKVGIKLLIIEIN